MRVKLSENGFKLVPEGEIFLTITKVDLVPVGKPSKMVIEMKDRDGAMVKSTYEFASNSKAHYAMSMLARTVLELSANDTDFEVSEMVGKSFIGLIEHNLYNGNTYANLRKVISNANSIEEISAQTSGEILE